MKRNMLVSGVVVLSMVCGLFAGRALGAPGSATTVIIPARYRMVQLGFDLQRLRGATLVSYRAAADKDAPMLFEWKGDRWTSLPLETLSGRAAEATPAEKFVVIGTDTPEAVLEACSRAPAVAKFETYDLASLVNNLDIIYRFSPGEWRFLASRYNFMLRDMNAKRRLYGRYGAPGFKAEPPTPEMVEQTPPPAEILPRLPDVPAEAMDAPAR